MRQHHWSRLQFCSYPPGRPDISVDFGTFRRFMAANHPETPKALNQPPPHVEQGRRILPVSDELCCSVRMLIYVAGSKLCDAAILRRFYRAPRSSGPSETRVVQHGFAVGNRGTEKISRAVFRARRTHLDGCPRRSLRFPLSCGPFLHDSDSLQGGRLTDTLAGDSPWKATRRVHHRSVQSTLRACGHRVSNAGVPDASERCEDSVPGTRQSVARCHPAQGTERSRRRVSRG
jgi:hypothetical protein